jgi:DNA-binding NtrC family response regulator
MGLRGRDQKTCTRLGGVSRGKALLVDEYPEDLRFYSTVLEAYGYAVRRCSSYHEGVRCLGEEAFAIVSQGTPNFEGSWVLMRAIEVNPRLPVLVVARCLDIDCYLAAMELGAMDYLVEPLTVWEIGRLLERHSQARAPQPKPSEQGLVGQALWCDSGTGLNQGMAPSIGSSLPLGKQASSR